MFFHPPRRHEIEIIEIHIANGNNLSFIDDVKNPTAVFWYLICFLKNIDEDLVGGFSDIIQNYDSYKLTKHDINKIIKRQNIFRFQ